jgi:hypothetical protein
MADSSKPTFTVFYAKRLPSICINFKNSFEKANEVSIFVLPLLRKGDSSFKGCCRVVEK